MGVEELMERRCLEKLELEKKIIGAGGFNQGIANEKNGDEGKNATNTNKKQDKVSQMDMLRDIIRKKKEEEEERKVNMKEGAAENKELTYDDATHESAFKATSFGELNEILLSRWGDKDEMEQKILEMEQKKGQKESSEATDAKMEDKIEDSGNNGVPANNDEKNDAEDRAAKVARILNAEDEVKRKERNIAGYRREKMLFARMDRLQGFGDSATSVRETLVLKKRLLADKYVPAKLEMAADEEETDEEDNNAMQT